MVVRSAAANRAHAVGLNPVDHGTRPGSYGGLVGQLINDIDVRMASSPTNVGLAPSREDVFHVVSICAGYAGLIAGFGAVAAGFWLVL